MDETLTEEQIFDLRRAFSSFDYHNDGSVRTKDIPTLFTHLDQSFKSCIVEGDELKSLIDRIDLENSGRLTFTQLVTLIAYKMNTNDTFEELQEAFRMFDRQSTGFITFDDVWRMMQSLGENLSKREVEEMMREADRDLDGKISCVEFIEMVRHPRNLD